VDEPRPDAPGAAELRQPNGENAELWAWFAAYDHVVLAQLWGSMPDLPRELPRFTRDLRQRWDDLGRPKLPQPPSDAHDALADARHNLARWKAMEASGCAAGTSCADLRGVACCTDTGHDTLS